MTELWLTRTLMGCQPADAESEAVLKKIPLGNTFPADIPTRKTRSLQWHKKYWQLLTMLAHHVERVEIEDGFTMEIKSKDDVHVALKYINGLYDSHPLPGAILRVIKSTAFDDMTADEWAAYWPKVLDAVHAKFLPGIELRSVEDELARMAS